MRRLSTLFVTLLAVASGACQKAPAAAPAGTTGDAKAAIVPFPCVHFEDLRQHLPRALEGLTSVRDEGSSGKYGDVSISEAERVYSGEEGREISIRIVDTTMVEELGRAIKAAAEDASERNQDDPTAPILSEGTVGFVRYDHDDQRAEANLLVAERFVVAVTTRGYDGTTEARKIAESIDVNGLALMR